ncbi:glucosamine-6-phosphate deaminase [Frondihabitans sp. PAMC 28766]|uniref:glucosamine-6-phosphate deaminase n=1 Tax=Frondihabitans sp. PAMC 28766 TaxID=1795630 RepID=UPI000AFBB3A9|nr:glucosamine-6-phosphate deaminase [Frondihabitans sp. PAMC 28766]
MEILILTDAQAVGRQAAAIVAKLVERNPEAVLGLATGASPQGLYAALADRVDAGLDLSKVAGFALDEYVGIPREHPESYAQVIDRDVTRPLGLDPRRVHVPDGRTADLEAATAAYDREIRAAGGIDLQILGIGENGHIGFNEPTSSFASRTRVKTLAPSTRAANARFFARPEDVPTHCLTQGLGTILEARQLVLVATGQSKAPAIAAAVEGPLTSMVPGSALQLHARATVIVDEAAASLLTLTDYYRYTADNRPVWQVVD